MADYGIENFFDDDMLYIRQPHCATSVRVKKEIIPRTVYDTFWNVELSSNGEDWQSVYSFDSKDEAFKARDRLADFIDSEAKC